MALSLFPWSWQAHSSAIAARSRLSLEHHPAEWSTASLGHFVTACHLFKMWPRVRETQLRSCGPSKDARQVHDRFFVNKYKSPILTLFCRLSELYFELWDMDEEETICVCLPLGLFLTLFSSFLSCFLRDGNIQFSSCSGFISFSSLSLFSNGQRHLRINLNSIILEILPNLSVFFFSCAFSFFSNPQAWRN